MRLESSRQSKSDEDEASKQIMRAILCATVIVLLMVLAGWLTFARNGNQASVTIETQKIKHDTERAIDRGKDVLRKVEHGTPVLDGQPAGAVIE